MSSKAETELFALTIFAAIFLVEKVICFYLSSPFILTDFSVALLTVPKAFLAIFGKAGGASNILLTRGVETWDLPSKALTEGTDPKFSPSLGATWVPGSYIHVYVYVCVYIYIHTHYSSFSSFSPFIHTWKQFSKSISWLTKLVVRKK